MRFNKKLLFFAVCLLVVDYLAGCGEKKPVRVGVALELTGHESDLGVQIRNGIRLAIDSVNEEGGINGRPVELIVRDDRGKPEFARKVDIDLIESGVVAIIGHVTSQQSLIGLTVTQPAGVVMISPTSSSSELIGNNNLFFSLIGENTHEAHALADHLLQDLGIQRIAVIYDQDNASFSRTLVEEFRSDFTRQGGNVSAILSFSNTGPSNFSPLISQAQSSKAQGLVLVTSAANAAFIVQKTRLMNWDIPVFSSIWALSDTFLQYGGQAIEGVKIVTPFSISPTTSKMEQFLQEYIHSFGMAPNFGAIQGYETGMVLIEALKRSNCDPHTLSESLHAIQQFNGLTGKITFNPSGNVDHPLYLTQVQNGEWGTVKILTVP